MTSITYIQRRSQIEDYFDRTAVETWSRLTSDAPVNRIRTTVRAGRDAMRRTLIDWLPADLTGCRLLDAGCGTGALAVEAARRGADVVAVDLSATLIDLARSRAAGVTGPGRLVFSAGDMLTPAHGEFDYVVAMDSLIHYASEDMVAAIRRDRLQLRLPRRNRSSFRDVGCDRPARTPCTNGSAAAFNKIRAG